MVLAFSHCLSGPFELLAVSRCLPWLMAFPHCLFQFQTVAACLSMSLMFAGYLSLFLWSYVVATCLSQSLIVAGCLSMCLPNAMEFLHVSHRLL